jgi:hypothetical protein
MRGASRNVAQRPPSTSSWPSIRKTRPTSGGMKTRPSASQTGWSSFPELGQYIYSRELDRQTVSDSTMMGFRRSGSSSPRLSSDALLLGWATNAWAMGASADDFPPCPPSAGWYGPWVSPPMHFHPGWSGPAQDFGHVGYYVGDGFYEHVGHQQGRGASG